MAQTRYSFSSTSNCAGGIADLAPYEIDTFLNAENTGVLQFGMGVVQGDKPGVNIKKPATGATAATFEGITTNNRTTEYDLEGGLSIRKAASVGVMRYGKIYGRVKHGDTIAYGDAVYLIVSGADAGHFTSVSTNNVAIKGRFVSGVDVTADIAMIELFNEAQA